MNQEIILHINNLALRGNLIIPDNPKGIVIFAHGSGSSRLSPRNQYVATILQNAGIATLLFDLLTITEETIDTLTAEYRFNIPLLAERLASVIDWVKTNPKTKTLPIGLYGASTGAGAALIAAAQKQRDIKAVVSRGGRPDLAEPSLKDVKAPTLLIVGGKDEQVIEMNKDAMHHMNVKTELKIVKGATHLFEESGTLAKTAILARTRFQKHLS